LGTPMKDQSRAPKSDKDRTNPSFLGGLKFRPVKDYLSETKGCPHILPLKLEYGNVLQVMEAPKINPNIGRILYNPRKKNMKYIRCI
jgi:hypothetical protein